MAKELPYFKFEPSEWLEGEIQICSDEAIVCFMNLCSGYWLKLGSISYAFALHKYMRKDANVLQELINCNIIAVQEDQIKIKFLDIQLKEFKSVSTQRSLAAKKRWSKPVDTKETHAIALQKLSKSNAIREEKRREEKIITIDIRDTEFKNSLQPFLETYGKDLLNEFYLYWTEKKPKGRKMRFELEKTFDIERRLQRWSKNDFNNKNNNNLKAENNEQLKSITTDIRANNPSL